MYLRKSFWIFLPCTKWKVICGSPEYKLDITWAVLCTCRCICRCSRYLCIYSVEAPPLRLRDTAGLHVLTIYSKFTYARYNFHLKQPWFEVTNCPSALRFVPPGCLAKRNLAGRFEDFDHACTTNPLGSVIASHCASFVSCLSTHLPCFAAVA